MQESVVKKEKTHIEKATQKALMFNIAFVATHSLIALIVGFLVSSQTILAEGITDLGAIPLAVLNIIAIKFIDKKNTKKYPFGKETLEPFIGIPNNVFLLVLSVLIIIDNAQMMFAGGNYEIHLPSSILFGIFSVIYNGIVYHYFKSVSKKNPSPIVIATLIAWKLSFMVGISIVLGFSITWTLSMSPISGIAPFIDPALAIILMVFFALSPVTGIRDCMRELMQTMPTEDITNDITEKIENVVKEYEISDSALRLGKVGNKVIIEVDYVVKEGTRLDSLVEQDQLRNLLSKSFAELDYKIWLNVSFTNDKKWTEHILTQI